MSSSIRQLVDTLAQADGTFDAKLHNKVFQLTSISTSKNTKHRIRRHVTKLPLSSLKLTTSSINTATTTTTSTTSRMDYSVALSMNALWTSYIHDSLGTNHLISLQQQQQPIKNASNHPLLLKLLKSDFHGALISGTSLNMS